VYERQQEREIGNRASGERETRREERKRRRK
jgi:hypothetical protein